ncbi:hypothetical protein [Halorarum salinum]|uniref:Uncharacterized protein n=1 Tax=Halorarum salinum TaxID=2743089 RepID=A0A7D5LBE1_9EURY|nr:hypothetical protein [Halobaculum salinum]QLG62531.1 hypothetical protein HUG12_12665 [Halobaculum salinum]
MADTPSVEEVEEGDDYYHVRFRDPDEFDEIRTPDWADKPAGSVVEGSEVRTGHEEGNDDWEIQSVLIPLDAVDDGDEAREKARDIVEKIES